MGFINLIRTITGSNSLAFAQDDDGSQRIVGVIRSRTPAALRDMPAQPHRFLKQKASDFRPKKSQDELMREEFEEFRQAKLEERRKSQHNPDFRNAAPQDKMSKALNQQMRIPKENKPKQQAEIQEEYAILVGRMKDEHNMNWAEITKELDISKKKAQQLYRYFTDKYGASENQARSTPNPLAKNIKSIIEETNKPESKESANKAKKRTPNTNNLRKLNGNDDDEADYVAFVSRPMPDKQFKAKDLELLCGIIESKMDSFWNEVAHGFYEETGRKVRPMDVAKRFSEKVSSDDSSTRKQKRVQKKNVTMEEMSSSSDEQW